MLSIRRLSKFKKDVKTCQKRGYNMELLKSVITTLAIPEQLEAKNRPHPLTGDYSSYEECHIAPDWLLIYQQTENELVLVRTGTHSDLFR